MNASVRTKRVRILKNKKWVVLGVCTMVALITTGAFLKPHSRAQSISRRQIPDHVLYRHVFHHVLALKNKAEEAEKNGEDATHLRTHFQRQAKLNDGQVAILEQAAVEYDLGEKLLDVRAQPIIAAYKTQFSNGQVLNHQPVAPPAELRSLSLERDALALRGKDQLRTAFGPDFARFDSFVKTRILADSNLQSR